MLEIETSVKIKVKFKKKPLKKLKTGESLKINGFGLCNGEFLETTIEKLGNGDYKITPFMETSECNETLLVVKTIEEVIEEVIKIYGTGEYYGWNYKRRKN